MSLSWANVLEAIEQDSVVDDWSPTDLLAILRHQLALDETLLSSQPSPDELQRIGRRRNSAPDKPSPYADDCLPRSVTDVLTSLYYAASFRADPQCAVVRDASIVGTVRRAMDQDWIDASVRSLLAPLLDQLIQLHGTGPSDVGGTDSGSASREQSEADRSDGDGRRGRYVIERAHAAGGLGVLSIARDPDLNRSVALKEIRPELRKDAASRQRFVREAQIAGTLEHPNIVPVYALGRDEAGNPYYAMRFVGGRTLEQAIAQHHENPSREGLRDLLRRFGDVCRAMSYAHSRGVVHRDLKPLNVMLGDFGESWIIDWGVAKRVDEVETGQPALAASADETVASASREHTLAGETLGTPRYMSPEQRFDARRAGPPADVYSLGAILSQIVSGTAPAAGTSRRKSRRSPRTQRGAGTAALDAIAARAMSASPAARYGNASELADDVERWLADEPVRAYREPLITTFGRWSRRHRPAVLAASALLLGSAVVLAISNVRIRGERDGKDAALLERQAALKVADENMAVARQNERTAQQRLSESLRLTGQSLVAQGRGTEAVARYREALAVTRSLGGTELGVTLGLLDAYRSVPPALATAQVSRDRIVPAFPEPTALLERDGRTVVVGEASGAVVWLDIATGIERARIKAHGSMARCLAASADGRRLLTGGDDGSIVIWDADARREIARVDAAHKRPVRRLVVSPRGDVFASAGDDGRVKVWDLATVQPRGDFPSHNGPEHVETIAFTPEGDAIISGCHDKRIVVWSWANGQTRATVQAHIDCVDDLELTNSNVLVSRSADGVIHTWTSAAAIDAPALSLQSADRHFRAVTCVGDRLFAGGIDGSITSWRLSGDGKSAEPLGTQLGPTAPISTLRVNTDRGVALRVDLNGTLSLVSLGASTNEVGVLRGHAAGVLSAVFSPDGLLAASASWDGTVRVWDVATQRELRRFGTGDGSTRYWSVTFGPDARSVIAGGDDGHVVAWPLSAADVKAPEPLYRIKAQDSLWRTSGPSAPATQPGNPTRPASAIVTCVTLSPDGRILASAGVDARIKLWDARTGAPIRTLAGHAENVRWVTFSPDGAKLVSGSYDRQAIVWDVARGAELARLGGRHKNWVNSVAVSPDGAHAVTGGRDGLLTLWDLKTGQPLRTTFGHAESVSAVSFSSDGRTIASGGEDRNIRIWDSVSGTELHHSVHHDAPVKDVRFSADGSQLLTASLDGTVGVIDLSRPAAYERFAVDCASAQQALQADPRDAAALQTLARWFAFRGCDWIAADLLRDAAESGAKDVSSLALARAQWRMGQYNEAMQNFKRAIERREAPAAYLELCASAVASAPARASR